MRYVLVVIGIGIRRILHCNVTHPTQVWGKALSQAALFRSLIALPDYRYDYPQAKICDNYWAAC